MVTKLKTCEICNKEIRSCYLKVKAHDKEKITCYTCHIKIKRILDFIKKNNKQRKYIENKIKTLKADIYMLNDKDKQLFEINKAQYEKLKELDYDMYKRIAGSSAL